LADAGDGPNSRYLRWNRDCRYRYGTEILSDSNGAPANAVPETVIRLPQRSTRQTDGHNQHRSNKPRDSDGQTMGHFH
jgi:hypothetical protein